MPNLKSYAVMYRKYSIALMSMVFLLTAAAGRAEEPRPAVIKVACVGDSITQGSGIADPASNSYPAQLGRMLGQGWQVENFGRSGATLVKRGDLPYYRTPQCEAALAFGPDIVVIKLGTNDTKPRNFEHIKDYQDDYVSLIESFMALETRPDIWICYPVPVYQDRWGISNTPIKEQLIPAIDEISKRTGARVIDLNTPMRGRPELFPDHIHPNAGGAEVIAQVVAQHIGNGVAENKD